MSFNSLHAWANQPWESDAERIASFGSPRYSDPNDAAYRDACVRKTEISMGIEADTSIRISNSGPNQIYVRTVNNEDTGDFSQVTEAATPEELQKYADLHADNPMALDPK